MGELKSCQARAEEMKDYLKGEGITEDELTKFLKEKGAECIKKFFDSIVEPLQEILRYLRDFKKNDIEKIDNVADDLSKQGRVGFKNHLGIAAYLCQYYNLKMLVNSKGGNYLGIFDAELFIKIITTPDFSSNKGKAYEILHIVIALLGESKHAKQISNALNYSCSAAVEFRLIKKTTSEALIRKRSADLANESPVRIPQSLIDQAVAKALAKQKELDEALDAKLAKCGKWYIKMTNGVMKFAARRWTGVVARKPVVWILKAVAWYLKSSDDDNAESPLGSLKKSFEKFTKKTDAILERHGGLEKLMDRAADNRVATTEAEILEQLQTSGSAYVSRTIQAAVTDSGA